MSSDNQKPIEDRLWAAASYIWFVSIVAIAARRQNAFINFHANQGLLLLVISLVAMLVPLIGQIVQLVIFVVAICAMIQALSGKEWKLPAGADQAQQLGAWVVRVLKL